MVIYAYRVAVIVHYYSLDQHDTVSLPRFFPSLGHLLTFYLRDIKAMLGAYLLSSGSFQDSSVFSLFRLFCKNVQCPFQFSCKMELVAGMLAQQRKYSLF